MKLRRLPLISHSKTYTPLTVLADADVADMYTLPCPVCPLLMLPAADRAVRMDATLAGADSDEYISSSHSASTSSPGSPWLEFTLTAAEREGRVANADCCCERLPLLLCSPVATSCSAAAASADVAGGALCSTFGQRGPPAKCCQYCCRRAILSLRLNCDEVTGAAATKLPMLLRELLLPGGAGGWPAAACCGGLGVPTSDRDSLMKGEIGDTGLLTSEAPVALSSPPERCLAAVSKAGVVLMGCKVLLVPWSEMERRSKAAETPAASGTRSSANERLVATPAAWSC